MTHASPKQKALFFALAHELGYDANTVKQRAKQRFGRVSFNDLTTEQLSDLIARLLAGQACRRQASAVGRTDQRDQLGPPASDHQMEPASPG